VQELKGKEEEGGRIERSPVLALPCDYDFLLSKRERKREKKSREWGE